MMNKDEAIKLLEEAIWKLRSPQKNSRGYEFQCGAVYWRITNVLSGFIAPQLQAAEGSHAIDLMRSHGLVVPFPGEMEALPWVNPYFHFYVNRDEQLQEQGIEKSKDQQRILRQKDVMERVGVSRATIDRWEANNTFPKRIKLGQNTVGWHKHEIDNWIANRVRSGCDQ